MYQKVLSHLLIITTWLPLLIAIVVGIFALWQIKSNNITNARIKWLDNIKQLFTDFLGECIAFQTKIGLSLKTNSYNKSILTDNQTSFLHEIHVSLLDHFKTIESKLLLIRLNLNPNETLHKKFDILLKKYTDILGEALRSNNYEDFDACMRKIEFYSDTTTLLLKLIIKLEWEKTKQSGISYKYYMAYGKGKKLFEDAIELEILPDIRPNI